MAKAGQGSGCPGSRLCDEEPLPSVWGAHCASSATDAPPPGDTHTPQRLRGHGRSNQPTHPSSCTHRPTPA